MTTFVGAQTSGPDGLSRIYIGDDGTKIERTGGTRSWRNNNPGNIARGPFADSEGAIGDDGRFAIFPDLETGFSALENLLQGNVYGPLTIEEAMYRYAPPIENDTEAYINFILDRTGLERYDVLDSLSSSEIREFARAIQDHEGFSSGTEIVISSPSNDGDGNEEAPELDYYLNADENHHPYFPEPHANSTPPYVIELETNENGSVANFILDVITAPFKYGMGGTAHAADASVTVKDEGSRVVATQTIPSENTGVVSSELPPGTYSVEVSSSSGEGKLQLAVQPLVDIETHEDGDNIRDAIDLGAVDGFRIVPKNMVTSGSDIFDYYAFSIDQPMNVIVAMTPDYDATGTAHMNIVREEGGYPQRMAAGRELSSGSEIETAKAQNLSPGTYYIQVVSETSGTVPYNLIMNTTPVNGEDDADDINNDDSENDESVSSQDGGWIGFEESAIAVEEGDGTRTVRAKLDWSNDVPNNTDFEWRLTPYGAHPADDKDLYMSNDDLPMTGGGTIADNIYNSSTNRVTLTIDGDEVPEEDEQLLLELISVDDGIEIAESKASSVITILDDDEGKEYHEPPDADEYIHVPEQDPFVDEGDDGTQAVEIGVARSGARSEEATFRWELVLNDGADAAGQEDFTSSTSFSGEGVFPQDQPVILIPFEIQGDREVEADEVASFQVRMGGSQPIVVDEGRDSTTITIVDDDAVGSDSANNSSSDPPADGGNAALGGAGNDDLGSFTSEELASTDIDGKGGWDSLKVEGDESVDFASITTLAGVEQLEFTGSAPVNASFSHLRGLTEGSEVMFVGMWDNPMTLDMEGLDYSDTNNVDGWARVIEADSFRFTTNDSIPLTVVDGSDGGGGAEDTPSQGVIGTSSNDDLGSIAVADLASTPIDGKGGWDELKVTGGGSVDLDDLSAIRNVELIEFTGDARISGSFFSLQSLAGGSEIMFVGMWDNPMTLDMEGRDYSDTNDVDGWARVIEADGFRFTTNSSAPLTIVEAQGDAPSLERIAGTGGSDELTLGGYQHLETGDGNDTVRASADDLATSIVDLGGWYDTLVVLGSGQSFDFASFDVRSLEQLTFEGSDNQVSLSFDDLLDISDSGGALQVNDLDRNDLFVDVPDGADVTQADHDGWATRHDITSDGQTASLIISDYESFDIT